MDNPKTFIYKKIEVVPYRVDLHLLYCNEDRFRKKIISLFGNIGGLNDEWFSDVGHLAGFHTIVEDKASRDYIIWIRPVKRKNSELFATISHETLHFVFKMLNHTGMKLCEESEEAYTYLHEHITSEIVHAIFRRK